MRRCLKCKSKFSPRARIKTLLDKNKTLECENCSSKYFQDLFQVKIVFLISALVYIIFDSKLTSILAKWIYSDLINQLITLLAGAIWMIFCVYVSQFFLRFKRDE